LEVPAQAADLAPRGTTRPELARGARKGLAGNGTKAMRQRMGTPRAGGSSQIGHAVWYRCGANFRATAESVTWILAAFYRRAL